MKNYEKELFEKNIICAFINNDNSIHMCFNWNFYYVQYK